MYNEITYISDVSSIYIFEIMNKKFVFFGDIHYSRSNGGCEERNLFKCDDFDVNFKNQKYYGSECTSIGVLLHNWFIYNNDHNIKTDVYLESGYTIDDNRIHPLQEIMENLEDVITDDSWLVITEAFMHKCLLHDKTQCPYYPNVHIHYADTRVLYHDKRVFGNPFILFELRDYLNQYLPQTIDDVNNIISQIKHILFFITHNYNTLINVMINPQAYEAILENLYSLLSGSGVLTNLYLLQIKNMAILSVIRNGMKMHRVAGELLRLQKINPTMKKLIEIYIDIKKDEFFNEFKYPLENAISKLNVIKSNLYQYEIEYIYEKIKNIFRVCIDSLISMSMLSMDAYVLARMFLQTDSQEIVVYAGNAHIRNYMEFFEYFLKIIPVVEPRNDGIRCLYIKNLPYYLPANKYRTYVQTHYR